MRRSRFQGLLNVVRFNYDMYVKAGLVLVLAYLIPWPRPLLPLVGLGCLGATYFLLASLLVSHYVYDLSDLYGWGWLEKRFPRPDRLVNIHSGFDETTEQLKQVFPHCEIETLDFYDPELMTEPSIERARATYPAKFGRSVKSHEFPLADGAEPLICCLLAAHELRSHTDKVAFLGEVARSLHPEGHFVMIEHMRDPANFLAFGPGFVHFFSRSTWLRALSDAGLSVREEFALTPFLRGFVCRATSQS